MGGGEGVGGSLVGGMGVKEKSLALLASTHNYPVHT